MKKLLIYMLTFSIVLGLAGCGAAEAKQEENLTEEGAAAAPDAPSLDAEDVGLEDYVVEYSDAVVAIIAKDWAVEGKEEGYLFRTDGTGEKTADGKTASFSYTCGFDADNHIILYLSEGVNEKYQIMSDETGYGVKLVPVDGRGEEKKLLPPNLKILDTEDEKVAGLIGVWTDDSGNEYEFKQDETFRILTREDSNGTFKASEDAEEGILKVSILVAGGTLQYEYEIQDEGQTLELYNRAAESWYYWHRK